jgi:DNA-binding protein HU-beta
LRKSPKIGALNKKKRLKLVVSVYLLYIFASLIDLFTLKKVDMNKGDLTNSVASAAGISKAQAADAVNAVFDSIEGALKSGDKAAFVGFGTFSVSKRAARDGRNPATGKTIKIAAKNVVKFKAGKALGDSVN